jgi:outer membrane protein assembly factor BamB
VRQQPFVPVQRLPLALSVACLCAAMLAGGCSRQKPQPAPAGEALPLQVFARQWATDLSLRRDPLEALHVRDDVVYAYSDGGRVFSLARDSGAVQFTRPIAGGRTLLHAPIVVSEKVEIRTPRELTIAAPVVFPTASTLEVLDKATGRFITSVDLDFSIRSGAVGRGPMVYLGAARRGSSRGAAIDIREPYVPVRWELMIPKGAISAAPALWEDTVFFGAEDGAVYAVTTASREPIWTLPDGIFRTGGPIVADLAVDADNVYVASTDHKLYALYRNSGKIRWQHFTNAALRAAPAVTSDSVYQFVPGTGLVALAKGPGDFNRKPKWVAADATQFLAQDARNAYVRTKDNRIAARDKQTGEVRFTSQRRDLTIFGTNLSKEDGVVYAGTKNGRIIAVRPVLKPGTVGEVVMVGSDEY